MKPITRKKGVQLASGDPDEALFVIVLARSSEQELSSWAKYPVDASCVERPIRVIDTV